MTRATTRTHHHARIAEPMLGAARISSLQRARPGGTCRSATTVQITKVSQIVRGMNRFMPPMSFFMVEGVHGHGPLSRTRGRGRP